MDAQTINMMRIAADAGDESMYLELGRRFFYGDGTDIDWISARHYLEKIDGDAEAFMMLGRIYQLGIGVKTDSMKVFSLYKKSAEMGNAEAMFRLGKMYMSGTYIRRNESKAYELIGRSILKGYVPKEDVQV